MKNKLNIYIIKIAFYSSFFLLWHFSYYYFDNLEMYIPPPVKIFQALYELSISGILFKFAVASLFRVTAGFYIAFLLAIPIGIILGRWTIGFNLFNNIIQFLRPISPLAWIPLTMIWFGIGDKPAVFLIFISCFFPLLISVITAVQEIGPKYFQIGSNFNFNNLEKIRYILLPAIIPQIVTAVRVSIGIAWLVVVAAEMIAVKSGLGYLIIDARNALRLDNVIAAMFVIGLIGLFLDRLILKLQHVKSLEWKFGKH